MGFIGNVGIKESPYESSADAGARMAEAAGGSL